MRLLGAIFAIVLLTACQPAVHPPQGGGQIPTKQGEIAVLRLDAPAPIELPGLSNLVAFQAIEAGRSGVISGSAPEGDRGFDSLEQLGIRTIISVDGAPPDAKAAAARGMRTVHIPIQYNGLTDLQRTTLVRAVRDLPKPIYLHCHHGKHRSAAACAIVAVSLGWLTTDEAAARMRVAGTSDGYRGLWACVADASVMTSSAIDAASRVCSVVVFGDAKCHGDIGFSCPNRDEHGGDLLAHALGNELPAIAARAGQQAKSKNRIRELRGPH